MQFSSHPAMRRGCAPLTRVSMCGFSFLHMSASAAASAILNTRRVSDAVRAAVSAFNANGVPEPNASAEWLALHVFRDNRGTRSVIRNDKSVVTKTELQMYADLCDERITRRVPVQYLVGEWEFHDIELMLKPPVLIPRPETEELVQLILESMSKSREGDSETRLDSNTSGSNNPGSAQTKSSTAAYTPSNVIEGTTTSQSGTRSRENYGPGQILNRVPENDTEVGMNILDVGCGSGAILLALLAASPTWRGVGIDPSADAIQLSRDNAERLGLVRRCGFDQSSVADWPGIEIYSDKIVTMAVRRRSRPPSSAPRKEKTRQSAQIGGAPVSNSNKAQTSSPGSPAASLALKSSKADSSADHAVEEPDSTLASRDDVEEVFILDDEAPGTRANGYFDILVSNPPYIPDGDIDGLQDEVLMHEDLGALSGGGSDGMGVIRDVLQRAPDLVRQGGRVWLEVDPSQPKLIERDIESARSGPLGRLRYVRTIRDFAGLDRFCEIEVL